VNLPENRNPEHGTPKQGSTLPAERETARAR